MLPLFGVCGWAGLLPDWMVPLIGLFVQVGLQAGLGSPMEPQAVLFDPVWPQAVSKNKQGD